MTLTRMTWKGREVKEKERHGAVRGLYLGTEHVLEVANRLVPIEKGTLMLSGVASVDENALRGADSFDTPYAVTQHEDMTMQHDAGRQAKYLEQPINSEQHAVEALIAREIKAELG